MKVELSYEEIQILIQCINNLNFGGEHIRSVGLLVDKLIKTKEQLEKKKPTDKEN
jgi:hypothetical protein